MPAIDGKVSDCCASSVPTTTSDRSPGITRIPPSMRRSSTCSIDMPATTVPSDSRWSSSGSPRSSSASVARKSVPTLGALSSASSGIDQTGTPAGTAPAIAAGMPSIASGSARFTITPAMDAWAAASSAVVTSASWRSSSAVRGPSVSGSRPPSTSSTEAPRFAATRALNPSSVGLPTSV